METPVLEIARAGLTAQLTPPPRILDVRTLGVTGCAFLLESEEGDRFQLVIDVDAEQATLHTHPGSRQREVSGGPFASRLVGGYFMSVKPGAFERTDEEGRRSDESSGGEGAGRYFEPRIVRLAVRKPGEAEPASRNWTLVVEWTGRSGNIRLVNSEGLVQETLRPLSPLAGEAYAAPPPDPRPSIAQIGPGQIERELSSSDPPNWAKRLSRLRGVTRVTAWEALWSSLNFDREVLAEASRFTDPIELLTDRATRPEFDLAAYAERVHRRLVQLVDERDQEAPSTFPRLLLYRTPEALQPILPVVIASDRAFDSLAPYRVENAPADPMAVLANAYSILVGARREQIRRDHYERRFRSEMQRLQRLRKKVAAEAASAEDAPKLRQYGEAILANLRTIKRGDASLVCDDWSAGPGAPKLEIRLDPARPATDSADQYFKRARRAGKARPIREKRIAKLDESMAKLSMLESRLRDHDSLPDAATIESGMRDALRSFYKEPPSPDPGLRLPRDITDRSGAGDGRSTGRTAGGGARGRPDDVTRTGGPAAMEARPSGIAANEARGPAARRDKSNGPRFRPREFTIRDGWKVIVGRSNEENDYVTHRLAKQEDYWFHASGVPGSHVVLKRAGRKDNPSTKVIEEAAAIAAFYSKSRNSRKAPVIYTLKKYVHKPRKAKPGLAMCTNEKTVMVAPTNPEEGLVPDWIAED